MGDASDDRKERLRLITPFDPWHGKFCTCPPKYSFSPYAGCGHRCTYCYITSYIPRAFEPRLKNVNSVQLERELKQLDKGMPISMANSSDPYTPTEAKNSIMRDILPLTIRNGLKLLIVTKSDLVTRDIDMLSKGKVCVSITLTTLNEEVAKRMEPFAPSPERRLKALMLLNKAGIPTLVRLDPLIPGVNDDAGSIEVVLEASSKVGVKQVTASTYKMRPDNLSRVMNAFPKLKVLEEMYAKGEHIGRSVYLPKEIRMELLSKVREVADELAMDFASCREGLGLNTAKTCDGSHMLL